MTHEKEILKKKKSKIHNVLSALIVIINNQLILT